MGFVAPGWEVLANGERPDVNSLDDAAGDPRLYVCQAPNAFICVSPSGSILGPFWVHVGSILGPFWVHFGSILGPFWVHFAYCLSGDAS